MSAEGTLRFPDAASTVGSSAAREVSTEPTERETPAETVGCSAATPRFVAGTSRITGIATCGAAALSVIVVEGTLITIGARAATPS